jgi:fatty acid amide hydrolase
MHPCLDWSASEIARRVAAREISAREVCQAFIARCEQVHSQLNALVWQRFDLALQEAAAVDEKIARGEPLGPLAGVPVTVKECFFVEGSPTTIGLTNRAGREPGLEQEWSDDRRLHSLAFLQTLSNMKAQGDVQGVQPCLSDPRVRSSAESMRRRTSPLVHQWQQAGGLLLGKTNVPQFMLWHECDNPVYGCTNNPWDLERTPGGSTGGEAALIAAHGSPLGLGTDMGGSLRVPASWCGVSTLMPTAQRVPTGGTLENFGWLEAIALAVGPMARHVEDLDLAMRVLLAPPLGMTRRQQLDHSFAVPPVAWPDFRAVDVRGLRVGVSSLALNMVPSAAVERAVREAAEVLRAAGATVTDKPLIQVDMQPYLGLITADGGACLREISRGSKLDWRASRIMWLAGLDRFRRSLLTTVLELIGERTMAAMVNSGGLGSARAFGELIRAQQQAKYRTHAEWERLQLDAILVPAHLLPAPQHGKAIDLVPAAEPAFFANLLGWPAGVVPVTTVRENEQGRRENKSRDRVLRQMAAVDAGSAGLPVGVQVIARPWREDIVLAVMATIEQAISRPVCKFLRS